MFTLINSVTLKVDFDPVETEDKYRPSVAFDIIVIWSTTFQKTEIEFKKYWVEYFELNQFQENLQKFIDEQIDFVKLSDMSFDPIIQFSRIDQTIFFEVSGKANFPSGSVKLKTEIENDELIESLERVKNWAKWW